MRIAVAGAGIAGMTAAIALARRGISVDLFDRAAAFEETGAGIQLSPNAMAVLERLDLAEALRPSLSEPAGIRLYDAPSGALLNRIPLGETARRRYGSPYCVIHRGDLHSALLHAATAEPRIAVALGATISEVRGTERGIEFDAAGRPERADVLVAADGIHSSVRQTHFGHPGPRESGRSAWRATLPCPASLPAGAGETGLWLAPAVHLVHYPVRAGSQLNVVLIAVGAGDDPPLEGFGPAIRPFLESVPQWRRWPLHDFDLKRPWVKGRVALVGDAAHAMQPSAAQGGAQAIEDAWLLADALAALPNRPDVALKRYEAARRRRVERVARTADRNLRTYELGGAAARLRNLGIRALPAQLHLARLDWLFGWKPPCKKA